MELLLKDAVFTSYEHFDKAFEKYKQEGKFIFAKRHSQTIQHYNSVVKKDDAKFPLEWKYKAVAFQCKHFGDYSSKSSGIRKDQE